MTKLMNAAQRLLAKQGRFGDTELVHVNPREKAMLKAAGGAGTINPKTGLKEFYDTGGYGGEFEGVSSSSQQAGGGVGNGGYYSWDGMGFQGYDANDPNANFGGWANGTANVYGENGTNYGSVRDFNSDGYGQAEFDAAAAQGQAAQPAASMMFDPTPVAQQQAALTGVSAPQNMLSAQQALAAPAPSMGMGAISRASAPMGNALQAGRAAPGAAQPEETPASRSFIDSFTDKTKSVRDQIMAGLDNLVNPDMNNLVTSPLDFSAAPRNVQQAQAASVPGFMGPAPIDQVMADEQAAKDIRMGYAVPDKPAPQVAGSTLSGYPAANVPTPTARPAYIDDGGTGVFTVDVTTPQGQKAVQDQIQGERSRVMDRVSGIYENAFDRQRSQPSFDNLTPEDRAIGAAPAAPAGLALSDFLGIGSAKAAERPAPAGPNPAGFDFTDPLVTDTRSPEAIAYAEAQSRSPAQAAIGSASAPALGAPQEVRAAPGAGPEFESYTRTNDFNIDPLTRGRYTTEQPVDNGGFESYTRGTNRQVDPLTRQSYDAETGNLHAIDPGTMSKGWGIAGGLLGSAAGGPIGGLIGGLAGRGFGSLMSDAQPGAPDFSAQTYGGAGEGGNEGAARAAQAALMAGAGGSVAAAAGAAGAAGNPFKNAIHDPLRNKWYTVPVR